MARNITVKTIIPLPTIIILLNSQMEFRLKLQLLAKTIDLEEVTQTENKREALP